MKRRKFLIFIVALFSFFIYFFLFDSNHISENKFLSNEKNKKKVGFSLQCALINGGDEISDLIQSNKFIENEYGMIEVDGFLVNKNELNDYIKSLQQY